MFSSPTREQALALACGLRGLEPDSSNENRGRIYELADIDAHGLTALDNLVRADDTPLDRELFAKSFQNYLSPDDRRASWAQEGGVQGIRRQRYMEGMDRPPRLLWLATRTSVYLQSLYVHLPESNQYMNFEPIAQGANRLELDEETVFRTLDIFAPQRPAEILHMLATSEHELVEHWVVRPQTLELLRGAIESADEKKAAKILKVAEDLLAFYLAKGPNDGAGAKWPRLARRLGLAEADSVISPETQRQLVASAWFGAQFPGEIPTGSRLQAGGWLSDEKLTIIAQEGGAAAKLYRQQLVEYSAALKRQKQQNFPEALRTRSRDTEIVLLTLMASLTPEDGNAELAALMRACLGEDHTYIRHQQPALAELLKAHNISVRNVGGEHYGVIEETGSHRVLEIDKYEPGAVIDLFGLPAEAHSDAEIVITIDHFGGQGEKALAEAVLRRTGKYPHFAYVPWHEPGEGTPYWKIKEFVPIPPVPVKKTLADVLAQAASSA